ncbi:MAG: class I SAM-dependent methyltransferase [Anaerolineae bacterium]
MHPLTLPLVDFLLTAEAQTALEELAGQDLSQQASLELLTRLRRRWLPDQAAALLDQARLRRKAGDKFPRPERLLFTDDALQQASPRAVAIYRSQQFAALLHRSPFTDHRPLIADLGCGLGADSIALAEAGLAVLAVERDPVRARVAAAQPGRAGPCRPLSRCCAPIGAPFFPGRRSSVGRSQRPPSSIPAAAPASSAFLTWTPWIRPFRPCWRCWSMCPPWR